MKRTPMSRGSGFKRRLPPTHTQAVHAAPVLAAATRRGTYAVVDMGMPMSVPKRPHAENRHLLDMARGKPCLIRSPICVGGTETTVACHGGGVANGKGLGYKVDDWRTAWGCYGCNQYTDAYSGATRAQKTAAFDMGFLRQVLEWRAIVADPTQRPKDRLAAQWALDHINATPVALDSPL